MVDDTLTTAELAELLDLPIRRAHVYLARDSGWRPFLEDPTPMGSGNYRRVTYRDAVVCACLRDIGEAGITGDVRSRLARTVQRVPWGAEAVVVTTDSGVAVRYSPRWALVDAVLPMIREGHRSAREHAVA